MNRLAPIPRLPLALSLLHRMVLPPIAVLLTLGCLWTVPQPLAAQPVSPRWSIGFAVGGALSRLQSASGAAHSGANVAVGWRVMYHTSDKVAVGIHAGATPYRHTGEGRPRRRGFEGLYPAVEWHPDASNWIAAGVGVHLDAPVFYDMHPSTAGESRFSPGLGGLLAVGRRVGTTSDGARMNGELVARAWTGRVRTPDGMLTGWALGVLAGGRATP